MKTNKLFMRWPNRNQKRPKIIILLIIVFLWSFGKDLLLTVGYPTTLDYLLFSHIGMEYLFFVFLISLVLLDGLTVWYLGKPKPIGFWIAISSLIVSSLENIISFSIAMKNIDVARDAYIISRQARGLFIREEGLDYAFSPNVMYISFGMIIGLSLFWAVLLFWKKSYFFDKVDVERNASPSTE